MRRPSRVSASLGDPFPHAFLARGAEDAPGEALERARERVLAWIVPRHVHGLNNLLMSAGFGGEAPRGAAAAQAALERMAQRLAALSRFARARPSGERALDELAGELLLLLERLAADCRVRLEVLACADGSAPDFPLGDLALLVAREVALLSRVPEPDRRALRLRVEGRGGGVLVVLTAAPAAREAAWDARVQDALAARLAGVGARLRGRTRAGARSWRLHVRGRVERARPRRPPPARVLLVADEDTGGLVAEVLREEFRVRHATAPPAALEALAREPFELVLLEPAAAEPALLERVQAEGGGGRRRVLALLGAGPRAGLPGYEGPMVGEPLLSFVRACLARRP